MRSSQSRWGFSVLCMLTILLAISALGLAQDYRGKVQGAVTDTGNAALANVKVTLRNDGTGVEVTRQTNTEGRYIFDFVESGTYTVIVEASGFKKYEQHNVVVQNRGDVTVDPRLEVGAVNEVVSIVDTPVAVQFNTSSTTLTIEHKVIDQLPIRGRNPYNVTTLDPTVTPGTGSTAGENRPYHHAYANDVDAGGQTSRANDVLLDGVPLTSSYKSSYTPALDAVSEVTFQKNAVDSEYGYSLGGVVILNMKSGTNNFHGSAFAHGRSPRFNAFADPTLARTPGADEKNFRGTNLKIYGGSLGGPIIKNKVFTFTSFEYWKDAQPLTLVLTVPTALERQGDFSQTLRNGVLRKIYNPFLSEGNNGVRPEFTGNKIPAELMDATALRLLNEIPLPNQPGNQNNWQGFKTNNTDYWNFSERIDWNISEKWKTFVRYGQFKAHLLEANPTDAALLPQNGSNRYGLSIAADTVYTISPRMVLNVRANFHKLTDEYAAEPALIGTQGLAQLWPNNPWYASLFTGPNVYYPALDIPNGNRLGRPGREFYQHPQGWGGSARMNVYLGNHSLKGGGEYRLDKGKGARFEPITFLFRQQTTANQATNPNANTGSEWATFLLGALELNGTNVTNNNFARRVILQEVVVPAYATYVMDDFKVNDRLTLNLGLRWEYEPGPVDAQNRFSQRLDLTNPIPEFQSTPPVFTGAAAQALTLLASKGYKPTYNGAWVFTDANNRHLWKKDVLNLLPRIGGAFRLNNKSVIRFGFARFMEPSSKIRDPLGDYVDQYTGYSTTSFALPFINGRPQVVLSDPFPAGKNPLQQPTGKSLGRYTNLGNAIASIDQYHQRPQINDRFSLSYQREIWGKIVLDADYFFNYGHNLVYSVDLNMADPAFRYELKSAINTTVPNPFFNYLTPDKFPGSLRTQSTISLGNLLRPYPQYGAITQANTAGRKQHFHTFSIQAQRPFSKGLSFLVAYAHVRDRTTEFFDDIATYARHFTWRDAETPRHRITSALTWDLPVGKGRWLLQDVPRPVDMIVGGWQFTTTTRFYSGRLLQFGQNLLVDGDPRLSNPTRGRWFDTSKFRQLPDAFTVRTNPYTYPGLVGPKVWQTDLTMSKSFRLTERFKLEARVEAYNAFNHLNFDNPGLDFTNQDLFGKVTRKLVAYTGREVQYGLRLTF